MPDNRANGFVISLREVGGKDKDFLENLYCDTRREEFAATGWTRAQINAFLATQFDLQTRAYEMQFPDAAHSIIEFENLAAGRLIVHRGAQEFRLIDIAVSPEFRGRGIGAAVVSELQCEAATQNKLLVLRVLKTNEKAVAFYEKLGFEKTDENLYWAMCWRGEN